MPEWFYVDLSSLKRLANKWVLALVNIDSRRPIVWRHIIELLQDHPNLIFQQQPKFLTSEFAMKLPSSKIKPLTLKPAGALSKRALMKSRRLKNYIRVIQITKDRLTLTTYLKDAYFTKKSVTSRNLTFRPFEFLSDQRLNEISQLLCEDYLKEISGESDIK